MASTSKAYNMLGKGWLILLLLIDLAVAAQSSAADHNETAAPEQDDFCPEFQYVYPYWTVCQWPLRHFQAFHVVSGLRGALETVAGTNLVSFTGSEAGATYYALPIGTRDPLLGVPVDTKVVLVNSKTRQPLTWTWRMVLTEGFSSIDNVAIFRFLKTDQALPCPYIAGGRCESYHLLSDNVAPHGLTAVNATAAGPAIIVPASAVSESLSFLAILPSADAAAAQQSAASTFRLSVK